MCCFTRVKEHHYSCVLHSETVSSLTGKCFVLCGLFLFFFKCLNSALLHSRYFVCFQICSHLKHLVLVNLQTRRPTGIKFSHSAMMEVSLKLPLFSENEREKWRGNTCLGHFQTRE